MKRRVLFCVELVQVPVVVGLASGESVQPHGNEHAAVDARTATHQVSAELPSTSSSLINTVHVNTRDVTSAVSRFRTARKMFDTIETFTQFGPIRIEYGKVQSKVSQVWLAAPRRPQSLRRHVRGRDEQLPQERLQGSSHIKLVHVSPRFNCTVLCRRARTWSSRASRRSTRRRRSPSSRSCSRCVAR